MQAFPTKLKYTHLQKGADYNTAPFEKYFIAVIRFVFGN